MDLKILESSGSTLILQQHKRLTLTGFVFCVPGMMFLFSLPKTYGLGMVIFCLFFLVAALFCFFRGITYTCTVSKAKQTVELKVKSIFTWKRKCWNHSEIKYVLMQEAARFLQLSENYDYNVLMDISNGKRVKLLGFHNRQTCKNTIILLDSYILEQVHSNQSARSLSVINR